MYTEYRCNLTTKSKDHATIKLLEITTQHKTGTRTEVYLNASNVWLELDVSLLHVITPGCEEILTHVLIKVTCNTHNLVFDILHI